MAVAMTNVESSADFTGMNVMAAVRMHIIVPVVLF
jgi:hypothetical protein